VFLLLEVGNNVIKQRSLAAALALVLALPVLAQTRRGPGGGSRNLNFLAGYLDLTDAQKTQAQAIFDAASAAAETARGQLTGARDALRAAAKANQSEAELDRLGAAVGAIEGQLAAIDAKAFAKFYALLTAEQKQKYDESGSARPGARRKGR
jgi:Spy/CpxP family protein refolding chaperone